MLGAARSPAGAPRAPPPFFVGYLAVDDPRLSSDAGIIIIINTPQTTQPEEEDRLSANKHVGVGPEEACQ